MLPFAQAHSGSHFRSGLLSYADIKPTALTAENLTELLLLSRKLKCPSMEARLVSWGHDVIAALDPFSCLDTARACNVRQWKIEAFMKICERRASLSAEEGEYLGFRVLAVVSRIREEHRDYATWPTRGQSALKQAVEKAAAELGI